MLLNKGDPQAALSAFERAAWLNRENKSAYNGLGVCLFQLQRPKEALEQFQRSLSIDPEDGEVNINLAAALVQVGEWDRAKAALKKGLERAPDNKTGNLLLNAFGEQPVRAENAVQRRPEQSSVGPPADTFQAGH